MIQKPLFFYTGTCSIDGRKPALHLILENTIQICDLIDFRI